MIHTTSIKLNKEFRRVYTRGNSSVASCVVVYMFKNRFATNRLGITVGKTIGKAVKRNRVKRIIRECYRRFEPDLKVGYDIVIVARTKAVTKDYKSIYRDLKYAFYKVGLLGNETK